MTTYGRVFIFTCNYRIVLDIPPLPLKTIDGIRRGIMDDYVSPPYEFTASVNYYHQLPRFGHGSDFTVFFSPNHDDQVDYAAGLVALFVCPIIFFAFWTIMIITFKAMGPANAGFLSGYHFVVPDPVDDDKNIRKR
jgi:hypothetical protein